MRRFLLLALLAAVLGGCRQRTGPGPNDDPRAFGTPVRMPERSDRYSDLRRHTFSELGADADPFLSADGKTLYYASSLHGPTYNLYEKDPSGRTIVLFSEDPGDERFPRVSPDGQWMAFAANRDGNWDLFRTAVSGRGEWLPIAADPEDELWPSWSPDGKSVAYCVLTPAGWVIRIVDGGGRKRDVAAGLFPAWHPTRGTIAFQRARQRDDPWFSIWTVDVETGRQSELVSARDWGAIQPVWSPDGRWLLFATVHKSATAQEEMREAHGDDFWVVPEAGGMPIALTDDDDPKGSPMWAKDGRIYFVTPRDGRPNVWSLLPALPRLE